MRSITDILIAALPEHIRPGEVPENPVPIAETNPEAFWTLFMAAVEANASIVLMDPAWPTGWKRQLGESSRQVGSSNQLRILIPTSGSTGLPKFCIHDSTTLEEAASGYRKRFGAEGITNSVNILPQHHVGGLMPVFRSAVSGGKVHFADYRHPGSILSAPFPLERASISVVPTQLRRMLADPRSLALLRQFALILVGGAACTPDLRKEARANGLRLAPCYGSTETAAMVSVMDPDDFLSGKEGVGTPMPHAKIEIDANQRVLVRSEALFRGYMPDRATFSNDPFVTGDLGSIDQNGHLHIHGRADRVIITGGEKVHPESVEAAAMSTGLVTSAHCTAVPDPDWGARVELEVHPMEPLAFRCEAFRAALVALLPAYAIPKTINCK